MFYLCLQRDTLSTRYRSQCKKKGSLENKDLKASILHEKVIKL